MTREEAIKMAKADLKCMERDTSGQDEMCNSHKCDECSLNYERGNMGEQKEWLRLAIKALEQEPRKGHWIVNKWGNISCSECGCNALYDKAYTDSPLFGKAIRIKSTFCPTCGADMREVEDGKEM